MAGKRMVEIGMDKLAAFQSKLDSARAKLASAKDTTDSVVNKVVRSTEVAAGTFILGGVEGYFGPVAPLGVPLELGVAIAAHGAGFLMHDTKVKGMQTSDHLHNLGDAALGIFTYKLGKDAGRTVAEKVDSASSTEEQIEVEGERLPPRSRVGAVEPLTEREKQIIEAK